MCGRLHGSLRSARGCPVPPRRASRVSRWPQQRGGVLRCSNRPRPPRRNSEPMTGSRVGVPQDWDDDLAMLSVETLENEVARLKLANRTLKEKLENAGNRIMRSRQRYFQAGRNKDDPSINGVLTADPESKPVVQPGSTPPIVSPAEIDDDGIEAKPGIGFEDDELWKKPRRTGPRLTIVYVSAEVSPWSKTGGLGDVAGSLPVALAELGHRVMVVTPRYLNGVNDGLYDNIHNKKCQVSLDLGHMGCQEVQFFHLNDKGVDWVFVDHPCFHRQGGPYGDSNGVFGDNLSRYAILSMAACEAPLNLYLPDGATDSASTYGEDVVLVSNDWHTGLIPVYLEHKYRPHGVYVDAKCVLSIHNLAHQGIEDPCHFRSLGLPDEAFGSLEWVADDGHQSINIMKGAIACSDRIVTVSRNHAWDITSKKGAMGLFPISSARADVMHGIVNGINTEEWNPQTDTFIKATYSYDDMDGKVECKASLQRELDFPVSRGIPLIGFVGRLDYQKGPDLILHALDSLAMEDCQVVMLGSGMPDLEALMTAKEYQHRDFFRGWVGYSVPLSHRIIAGCDILLIPSRFEPCGLIQFYAMRYGTVPIAHATGGLSETIEDFNPFGTETKSMGTGWTFPEPTMESMVETIKAALKVFKYDRRRWNSLQNGMLKDFSWAKSATMYEAVFRKTVVDREESS